MLNSQDSERIVEGIPIRGVSGAFQEYQTDLEKSAEIRENVTAKDATAAVSRVVDHRFAEVRSKSSANLIDRSESEQVCEKTYYGNTFIAMPCQKIFTDSVPNPLRRRNLDLLYYKD